MTDGQTTAIQWSFVFTAYVKNISFSPSHSSHPVFGHSLQKLPSFTSNQKPTSRNQGSKLRRETRALKNFSNLTPSHFYLKYHRTLWPTSHPQTLASKPPSSLFHLPTKREQLQWCSIKDARIDESGLEKLANFLKNKQKRIWLRFSQIPRKIWRNSTTSEKIH